MQDQLSGGTGSGPAKRTRPMLLDETLLALDPFLRIHIPAALERDGSEVIVLGRRSAPRAEIPMLNHWTKTAMVFSSDIQPETNHHETSQYHPDRTSADPA